MLTLHVTGIDLTNSFLSTLLNDEICVYAPPGFPPFLNGYVYKLTLTKYGLKQSPRVWNNTLHTFLTQDCHFTQLGTEHCLYLRSNSKDGSYCLVCLYEDDMIVTYTNKSMCDAFLTKLPVQTPSGHHIRMCKAGFYRVQSSYWFKGGQSLESTDDTEFATAHTLNASYRAVIDCLL